MIEILLKLPPKDILHICIADKRFHYVCNSEFLWKQLLQRDFPKDYSNFLQDQEFKKVSYMDQYKLLFGLERTYFELFTSKTDLYEFYHETTLDLVREDLHSVPKEIGYLTNLQELHLQHNYLKSIPKEIGNLRNLKKLNLSYNLLESLPKEMGNLKKLKYLYLNNNDLVTLPKEIANLTKLRDLHLEYNFIDSLPKEFKNLDNLQQRSKNMIQFIF